MTTAKEYRRRTLDDWCEKVRCLGVSTLSQWALADRSGYNHAVILGVQRDVARALGWIPKLEAGEMERLTNEEFAHRFKAKGVQNMSDMWRSAQHYCEYLRREGRLEAVAAILNLGYEETFYSNDVNFYLERCRRIGDLRAWCLADRNAADAARRYGVMDELRRLAPKLPRNGYQTAGGFCQSLPELAVARLLEANEIDFVTQVPYAFTFPRGMRHSSKCDFYLSTVGAYVEVWSTSLDDLSPHWESYHVRRRFKRAMCDRLNLRLLDLEGQLIFRPGPEAYLRHVTEVLHNAGIEIHTQLDRYAALLACKPEEVSGNGI